jgi:hypothetical protein
MDAFLFIARFTLTLGLDTLFGLLNRRRGASKKEKEMNTQTETKLVVKVAETALEAENPMQERHCGQVAESVEVAAEVVFAARRLEVQEAAGAVFVP